MSESKDDKKEASWPVTVKVAQGTLVMSRVCVADASPTGPPSAATGAPPEYAHAMSDGFRAVFTTNGTRDVYTCTESDSDVAELCSGGIIIEADTLSDIILDQPPAITISPDIVTVCWKVPIVGRRKCHIEFSLPRDKSADGPIAAYDARLRAQALRIHELETRLAALEKSAAVAQTMAFSQRLFHEGPYYWIAKYAAVGVTIRQVMEHDDEEARKSIYQSLLPHIHDQDADKRIKVLLDAGLDPNLRDTGCYCAICENEVPGKDPVSRNETLLHLYASRFYKDMGIANEDTAVNIFQTLIAGGANIKLKDNRGETALVWLSRAEIRMGEVPLQYHNPDWMANRHRVQRVLQKVKTLLSA